MIGLPLLVFSPTTLATFIICPAGLRAKRGKENKERDQFSFLSFFSYILLAIISLLLCELFANFAKSTAI